jgi:hypothetical protein
MGDEETDSGQSLVSANQPYHSWVKDSTISSGSTGSCNADSKYMDDNVKSGSDDANRYYDYYFCDTGDDNGDKCIGWTWDKWNTTWGNCQKGDTNDKCVNMATTDTPGVTEFGMGMLSDTNDMYNPITNSGCGNCSLSQRQNADADNYESLGDDNPYNSGLSKELLFSTDGENDPIAMPDNCSDCRISGVSGMRPAYPNNSNEIDKIDTLDSAVFSSNLLPCPSGFSRELNCELDGWSTDNPGCGFVSSNNKDEDSAIRFCARDESHFTNENIAECCLEREEESSNFKNCPRDYCVSNKVPWEDLTTDEKTKCIPDTDEDGNSYCKKMNDSCNNFFNDICTKNDGEAFSDVRHEMHGKCKEWAHIMPSGFASVADRVCNIDEDADIANDENEKRRIRNLFTNNQLCRNYIINNLPSYVGKLDKICENAVMKNGDDWEVTNFGESMSSICPCYYPEEYNEWYKEKHFEGEDQAKSSMSLQVKPECYMPECQSTLLYDTSGSSGGCPSLQVCANEIAMNVSVAGSGEINLENAQAGVQECNFSSVIQQNDEVVSDLTKSGSGSSNPSGSSSSERESSRESDGNNTMMIFGGFIVFLIILIIMYFLLSGDESVPAIADSVSSAVVSVDGGRR